MEKSQNIMPLMSGLNKANEKSCQDKDGDE